MSKRPHIVPVKRVRQLLYPPYSKKDLLIFFLSLVLLVGLPLAVLLSSRTANFFGQAAGSTSIEVENGTIAGAVALLNDANASGGKYIRLGTVSACPTAAATAQMPQPQPVVNVKNYGAVGNGTTDDQPAIQSALAAVKNAGKGTLYFPAGTYRIGRQGPPAPLYFDGVSDVTINFDPSATLLMDNLNADGTGGGHGVVFKNHASNIWLNNVRVVWKNLPSSRSNGDGIRFDGYPSDAATISNVYLINPTVEKAPQAGIIFMGISDVYVKNATVKDTLADGLHINASRRVTIDTYLAQNLGDDGLPFVTYYNPTSVYVYPGSNTGPYAQPALGEWSNTDSCATNITINGSSANGSRINGGNRIHVTNLQATNVGFGLMIDATEGNGGSLGWNVEASKGIVVDGLTVSGSERGFTAVHQGGDRYNSPSRFWDFDVQINNVNVNNNTSIWAGGSLEYVQNVRVNGVYGNNRDNVNMSDCRNCIINKN